MVIGIIGLLAALLTPVVMRSLASARNAAIKAEIDMLHMAMMNYQSEYGVLPPCIEPPALLSSGSYTSGGPSAKHLKRIFPRCADPATQLNDVNRPNSGPIALTPINALPAWLSGFTTNPASPLVPGGARVKLFDFDKSRIDSQTKGYFPSGKRDSPFVYIDRSQYGLIVNGTSNNPFAVGSNSYGAIPRSATEFFNSDTFQILSAGRDEVWGNDDDLSNFWPGTRRDYLDSLKN